MASKKEDIDTVQLEFFKVAKNALKNNDGPVQESFSPNAAFGRYIATELDQLSPQLQKQAKRDIHNVLFNLPADLGQDDTQQTQQLITNPPHQQPMRTSQVYTGHSSQFVSSNSQMHGCHRVRPYSLQRNDFPIQQDQYQDVLSDTQRFVTRICLNNPFADIFQQKSASSSCEYSS